MIFSTVIPNKKINYKKTNSITLLLTAFLVFFTNQTPAEENENSEVASEEVIAPKDIKIFDLPLLTTTQKQVNKHFATIGGFKQSRTSFGEKHYDKFYSHSQLADSYYLDFRFNNAGQVTRLIRVYRPYNHSVIDSVDQNSQALTTKRLAQKFVKILGQPTSMERKGWGGFKPYTAYIWEDDAMKITIDRQGNESLGKVFMRYEIKGIPIHLAQN